MNPVDPEFGNHNGDNLTEDPEDEYDENAHYNWTDHPIRKFFNNPRTSFHPSFIEDGHHEPEPDD